MGDLDALIIDGDAGEGLALVRAARAEGLKARYIGDPETYRAMILANQPAVVVTDLATPGMTGVDIMRWFTDHGQRPHFVILTARDDEVTASATAFAERLGLTVVDTLMKPVADHTFRKMLHEHLAQSSSFSPAQEREETVRDIADWTVFYQPVITPASGGWRVKGGEALVRSIRPDGSVGSALEVLEAFRERNAMTELTVSICKLAAADLQSFHELDDDLQISINIPPQSLGDPALVDILPGIFESRGVELGKVTLEITEESETLEGVDAHQILTDLRIRGFDISLDDFGAGYSALLRLYRLPFTEVKIDREFVQDMNQQDEADVIVQSTVQLARRLGKRTCAEGVEARDTLSRLRRIRCARMQGYLVSRPLPRTKFMEFIHRSKEPTRRSTGRLTFPPN